MDNSSSRWLFGLIGVLIVVAMIISNWLSREIAAPEPARPTVKVEEAPVQEIRIEQKDYNPHSDYAPVPTTEGLAQETFEEKKPERVPSSQIIYEMPINERFLVQ